MDIKSVPGTYDEQLQWLNTMGQSLINKDEIRNITVMEQCEILYYVYRAWTTEALSSEAKGHWGYDFYQWAKAFAQRRGKQPANITIDNQIAVYRDYVAEAIVEPPAYVEIPARDPKTNMPIEGETQRIEANFKTCDYTKLLIARRAAKQREMTPETWSMLFNPSITTTELTKKIKNIPDNNPELSFYERDGILYVRTQFDAPIPLFEIIDDARDNQTWQEGIDKLLSPVNVHIAVREGL